MRRFENRVAVVTGAANGIGRAVAERLAAEGARLGLIDIDADAGEQLAHALPGDALFVHASVADARQLAAAMDAIATQFGGVQMLHANAGVETTGELAHELPVDSWRRILSVNLDGVFYACRAAIPHLLVAGGGSIVCTSSIHSRATQPGTAPYATAKGGVDALVRALALDYARENIRVNGVLPGAITTPLLNRLRAAADDADEWLAGATALQPIGRLGEPEEVAELVCFLASDSASFITGELISADGGALARLA